MTAPRLQSLQVTSVRSEEDLDVDATNPYADLPWTHHGEPAKEPGRMLMKTLDDQDFTCMVKRGKHMDIPYFSMDLLPSSKHFWVWYE